MKLLLATALAAATATPAVTPALAEPVNAGRHCTVTHYNDLWTVDSYPAVAADVADVTQPVSITVHCDIQVNGTGTYLDPNAVRESATGTAVAAVQPARQWTYAFAPGDVIWVCTTWVVTDAAGRTWTYYRHDQEHTMRTDPSAECVGPLETSGS